MCVFGRAMSRRRRRASVVAIPDRTPEAYHKSPFLRLSVNAGPHTHLDAPAPLGEPHQTELGPYGVFTIMRRINEDLSKGEPVSAEARPSGDIEPFALASAAKGARGHLDVQERTVRERASAKQAKLASTLAALG